MPSIPLRPSAVSSTLVLCLALSLAAGAAVPTAGPAGHWEGAIELPGTELGVVVDLAPGPGGAWRGEIDIPLQGAKDLALADVTVEGDAISFAIAGVPGAPTFSGTLSADGQSIAGQFVQAGANFPFQLSRKGEATLSGKKSAIQRLDGFDAFVEAQMKEWNVPGVAVAIVVDGKVVLERGYGQRDVKAGLPVDAHTLFAIGSSTKAFTALDLAILVDEGKLDWDQPVTSYLPDFKMQDETATKLMTPKDLVTHRSGLPRHDLMWYGSDATREQMFAGLQYLQPSASIRNRFQYQNLMFMTAGILAGRLAGTSWEAFTRERILGPLGMESTVFALEDAAKTGNVSKPYEQKKETKELAEMAYRDIREVGPAGAIFSSAHDMAEWVRFQLGDGTRDGTAVVSATQLAETHKPQMVGETPFVFPENPIVLYGLGWFIQPYRGHARIHHGGNIDGF
nr:beta-lactamase family protein [Acidobacteriota bacterium]